MRAIPVTNQLSPGITSLDHLTFSSPSTPPLPPSLKPHDVIPCALKFLFLYIVSSGTVLYARDYCRLSNYYVIVSLCYGSLRSVLSLYYDDTGEWTPVKFTLLTQWETNKPVWDKWWDECETSDKTVWCYWTNARHGFLVSFLTIDDENYAFLRIDINAIFGRIFNFIRKLFLKTLQDIKKAQNF